MHIDPNTRDTLVALTILLGFLASVVVVMWKTWWLPWLQHEVIEPAKQARDDGEVVRDHVANTHETNLREDIDRQSDLLETTASAVYRLQVGQEALSAAVERVASRLAEGDRRFDSQDAQLVELKRLAAEHHPDSGA